MGREVKGRVTSTRVLALHSMTKHKQKQLPFEHVFHKYKFCSEKNSEPVLKKRVLLSIIQAQGLLGVHTHTERMIRNLRPGSEVFDSRENKNDQFATVGLNPSDYQGRLASDAASGGPSSS